MNVYKDIYVVHVYNYRKERGTRNPITPFRAACKPFSPSTCMRHVYVVHCNSDDKKKAIQRFVDIVTPTCDFAHVLSGEEAYEFMLKWSVGLLSSKLFGNDHFVLGAIRAEWQKFVRNKRVSAEPFFTFMRAILTDAKAVRSVADTRMLTLKSELAPTGKPKLIDIGEARAGAGEEEHEHDQLPSPSTLLSPRVLVRHLSGVSLLSVRPVFGGLDKEGNEVFGRDTASLASASTADPKLAGGIFLSGFDLKSAADLRVAMGPVMKVGVDSKPSAAAGGGASIEAVEGVDKVDAGGADAKLLEACHRGVHELMGNCAENCLSSRRLNIEPAPDHLHLPQDSYKRVALSRAEASLKRRMRGLQKKTAIGEEGVILPSHSASVRAEASQRFFLFAKAMECAFKKGKVSAEKSRLTP